MIQGHSSEVSFGLLYYTLSAYHNDSKALMCVPVYLLYEAIRLKAKVCNTVCKCAIFAPKVCYSVLYLPFDLGLCK